MLLIKMIYLLGLLFCLTAGMVSAADAEADAEPLEVSLQFENDTVELGDFLELRVTVKNISAEEVEIPELTFDYRSVIFVFPEENPTEKEDSFGKTYIQIAQEDGVFLPINHVDLAAGESISSVFKIPTCEAGKSSVQAVFRAGPNQVISDSAEFNVKGEGKELIVRLETNQGEMLIRVFPDLAFNHALHFIGRAKEGKYDNLIFHRVISGFMIQGGDPLGNGMGGPGYVIPEEFSDTPHKPGILSMARVNDPNSAGCQFFICHGEPSFLDGNYTVFGEVFEGLEVVNKIAESKKDADDRPLEDQKMISMKVETRDVE